ncbi:MAG: flagellar hook-associated protein FlgL [Pseudomonadota bacterium]|nr:flagellar hook-associated protein FlgL [Pseudomonadota bacterium]
MKISNKLFNDQSLSQFSKNMENIQKIQEKISSGKNIIFASDDPVGAVQLSGMKDTLNKVNRFIENSNIAVDRLNLMDATMVGVNNVFIRAKELAVQAANDIYGVMDREAIAIEFDEMKKELMTLANTQDSTGTYIYAGYKTKQMPFQINANGTVDYKGDRGVLNLQVTESRLVETSLDGSTVFQDIVTSEGVSTDLFAAIDNISRSIRTASGGVEEAKAEGIAKMSLTNANPGTYSFTIKSESKSADFSLDITGSDLSDIRTAINAANLDITATLEDSNKTLKLVSNFGYDIEFSNLQIQGIDKAQDTPTSFFTFQPVDAAGNKTANEQTIYDKDQTIASRLDEIVTIQSHVSNQRAKVGARMNSAERLKDVLQERKILVSQDVSDLEDADLASLVTSLQSQLTSQEASQKAFINIAKLNLFDFLG